MRPTRAGIAFTTLAVMCALGGCDQPTPATPARSSTPRTPPIATSAATSGATSSATNGASTVAPSASRPSKVLVIAEENHSFGEVIGDPSTPYINQLATSYGLATNMAAGYPPQCPSLAAYILLTSGSTHGICDDEAPSAHPLTGDNVFAETVAAGGQWRNYAESATGACARADADNGRFLVRHTPAAYYVSEAERCPRWDLPLGTTAVGALHDDLVAGTLPAYGFISPDACDDMHGAPGCTAGATNTADAWLRTWMPMVLASPDYTGGRLVVIITWDEGTDTDNHIPTVVISPSTRHVRSATAYTHCSTLRTTEEILRLPLLGCAATATSMLADFRLAPSGR